MLGSGRSRLGDQSETVSTDVLLVEDASAGNASAGDRQWWRSVGGRSASGGVIQAPGTPSAETEPIPSNSRAARTTTAAAQAAIPTAPERTQPSR